MLRKILSEFFGDNFKFRILYHFENNGDNSIIVSDNENHLWYLSELPDSIRSRVYSEINRRNYNMLIKILSEFFGDNFRFRILHNFRNNGENSIIVIDDENCRWYLSELPDSIRSRVYLEIN